MRRKDDRYRGEGGDWTNRRRGCRICRALLARSDKLCAGGMSGCLDAQHRAVVGTITATACGQSGVLVCSGRKKRRGQREAKHAQQKDGQKAAHEPIVAQS
jgi:hypothetical protein